ncbi:MAG: site-specific integrase [Candidatus Wallbacteria bacterium]|nr:site-specific integrase [Candidatus Wallbacteria bacterium]
MPGFRRRQIEEDIHWWRPCSIRVLVRLPGGQRPGLTFRLPHGYTPKVQDDRVILEGPAQEVLAAARRARQSLWDRRTRLLRGLPDTEGAASSVTVTEVFDRLLRRTATRRRRHTVRSYASLRGRIEAAFGSRSLFSVRTTDVEDWLDELLREGLQPSTVQHYRQVMIRLFNVAIKADLYPYANPAAKTEPIEVQERPGRPLNGHELTALLKAAVQEQRGQLWYSLFATMALTGLRFQETSLLQWEDFDWQAEECTPTHQKASRRKDTIVITPELEAVLSFVEPRAPLTGLVFPNGSGDPLTYGTALRAIRRVAKVAKILDASSLGLHALRRTAITEAERAAGGDVTSLMGFGRQLDYGVTRRYLPKVPAGVRQLTLKMATAVGKAAGVVIPLRAWRKGRAA